MDDWAVATLVAALTLTCIAVFAALSLVWHRVPTPNWLKQWRKSHPSKKHQQKRRRSSVVRHLHKGVPQPRKPSRAVNPHYPDVEQALRAAATDAQERGAIAAKPHDPLHEPLATPAHPRQRLGSFAESAVDLSRNSSRGSGSRSGSSYFGSFRSQSRSFSRGSASRTSDSFAEQRPLFAVDFAAIHAADGPSVADLARDEATRTAIALEPKPEEIARVRAMGWSASFKQVSSAGDVPKRIWQSERGQSAVLNPGKITHLVAPKKRVRKVGEAPTPPVLRHATSDIAARRDSKSQGPRLRRGSTAGLPQACGSRRNSCVAEPPSVLERANTVLERANTGNLRIQGLEQAVAASAPPKDSRFQRLRRGALSPRVSPRVRLSRGDGETREARKEERRDSRFEPVARRGSRLAETLFQSARWQSRRKSERPSEHASERRVSMRASECKSRVQEAAAPSTKEALYADEDKSRRGASCGTECGPVRSNPDEYAVLGTALPMESQKLTDIIDDDGSHSRVLPPERSDHGGSEDDNATPCAVVVPQEDALVEPVEPVEEHELALKEALEEAPR